MQDLFIFLKFLSNMWNINTSLSLPLPKIFGHTKWILHFVGLDNILSYKTTADFNDVKKLYLQCQNKERFINIDIKMFPIELTVKAGDTTGTRLELNFFCQILMAIKE